MAILPGQQTDDGMEIEHDRPPLATLLMEDRINKTEKRSKVLQLPSTSSGPGRRSHRRGAVATAGDRTQ